MWKITSSDITETIGAIAVADLVQAGQAIVVDTDLDTAVTEDHISDAVTSRISSLVLPINYYLFIIS